MFKGFKEGISKLVHKLKEKSLTEKEVESIIDDFYITLISNDVALNVADEIINEVKLSLIGKSVSRFTNISELFLDSLRSALYNTLKLGQGDDLCDIIRRSDKPFSIVFFGVNGVGKTTTIAKVAWMLKNKGFSVVMACSDTFRAAAIEQLKYHADKLGVKMIRHNYGSDPAAVAFDAISHAKSKKIDVVLIDTAGRQHSNINLMDELKKIVRIINPSCKILVLDALTGNDAYNQAIYFEEGVGVDALIFTKVDADVKGGAIITVIRTIKKPVLYLGIGQKYEDLIPYDPNYILSRLLV